MTSTINMTPEDRLELENSLKKASEILYRYSKEDVNKILQLRCAYLNSKSILLP